jgi:hypothetical protein
MTSEAMRSAVEDADAADSPSSHEWPPLKR